MAQNLEIKKQMFPAGGFISNSRDFRPHFNIRCTLRATLKEILIHSAVACTLVSVGRLSALLQPENLSSLLNRSLIEMNLRICICKSIPDNFPQFNSYSSSVRCNSFSDTLISVFLTRMSTNKVSSVKTSFCPQTRFQYSEDEPI